MDIADIRLRNALLLRDHFLRKWQADGDDRVATPERSFAAFVGVNPAHWSQLKSGHRHIGAKLARQIEAHCRMAGGSLDEAGAARLPARVLPAAVACADEDERHAVQLFLTAYRIDKQAAKARMLEILQSRLAASPAAGATGDRKVPSVGAARKRRPPA